MLKIKEDKMQELEKFGFEYDKIYKCYRKAIWESDCCLVVDLHRIICHENYSTADMNGNARELAVALYELFVNDMVEKIGEE